MENSAKEWWRMALLRKKRLQEFERQECQGMMKGGTGEENSATSEGSISRKGVLEKEECRCDNKWH